VVPTLLSQYGWIAYAVVSAVAAVVAFAILIQLHRAK
jgi:hypothetical protein